MSASPNIFLLDDDLGFRDHMREALGGLYRLEEAGAEEEFRAKWRAFGYDLLLLDMRLRVDREGLDVLRAVFREDPLQPVIMVSAYGDTESAIEAVGAGAMMFLHKEEFTPALVARMVESVLERGRLRRQVALLRSRERARDTEALLGLCAGMRRVNEEIRKAAESMKPMAIYGERGTGTSLAARLVHRYSRRAESGFLEVGPEELHNGEEEIWARVKGGTLTVRVSVDAPNDSGEWLGVRDLARRSFENGTGVVFLIQKGLFAKQQGLFHGEMGFLQGMEEIRLPPLRERVGDVAGLAGHFLQRQALTGHTEVRSLGRDALAALEGWSWPGNVRELRLAVEYAALRAWSEGRETVGCGDLPGQLGATVESDAGPEAWNYQFQTARTEVALVNRAMRERGVRQKVALAKALGYSNRHTLMRRIAKLLLDHAELRREFPEVAKLFATDVAAEREDRKARKANANGGAKGGKRAKRKAVAG